MRLAFVGLGEAASAIIGGWGAARAGDIAAYDIKSDSPETAGEIAARAEGLGIRACGSLAEALDGAEIVFCTVTADQAVIAAEAGARHVGARALWCDLNSCAPGSKRRSAGVITAAGARYLDVAVMAPVYPKRNMVPCLLAGAEAEAVEPVLAAMPMDVRVVGTEVGRASAIKMIRSIMVKGLEALTAECTLAAVAAGVEGEVLPSLLHGHPKLDVAERAAYNFERSLVHGQRRAAEMDEVAITVAELGLPNGMAAAAAEWQRAVAAAGAGLSEGVVGADYRTVAEAILPKIKAP